MTMRRRVRGDASVVARRAIEREWATKVDRGIDRVDARGRRLSTRRAPSSTSRSSAQRATDIRASFSTTRKKSRVATDGGNRRARDAKRGIGVIETPRRALKRDRTARGEEEMDARGATRKRCRKRQLYVRRKGDMRDTSPLELLSARTIDIRNATASAATTRRASSASPRPFAATAPRTRSRTFTSRARIMFTAARASATMLRAPSVRPRPTPRAAAASAPLGRVAATPLRAVVARAYGERRTERRPGGWTNEFGDEYEDIDADDGYFEPRSAPRRGGRFGDERGGYADRRRGGDDFRGGRDRRRGGRPRGGAGDDDDWIEVRPSTSLSFFIPASSPPTPSRRPVPAPKPARREEENSASFAAKTRLASFSSSSAASLPLRSRNPSLRR